MGGLAWTRRWMSMGQARGTFAAGRWRARGSGPICQAQAQPEEAWPQIKALVAPRLGLLLAGMGLMVINRFAGLVLPYTSKPLLDTVLSPTHPRPDRCPLSSPWSSQQMVVQAITSFSLTQLLSKAARGSSPRCAVRCKGTWGCSPFPTMKTRTARHAGGAHMSDVERRA